MKNIIGIFAIAFLVSTGAYAQNKMVKNNFTPEQIATLQTKRMTLNFDLNKNQQEAVYNLKVKQANERLKALEILRQKKQSGVQPTSNERFEFRKIRLEKQLENKTAMKKILTEEQYGKWEAQLRKNKNHFAYNKKAVNNCRYYNK